MLRKQIRFQLPKNIIYAINLYNKQIAEWLKGKSEPVHDTSGEVDGIKDVETSKVSNLIFFVYAIKYNHYLCII